MMEYPSEAGAYEVRVARRACRAQPSIDAHSACSAMRAEASLRGSCRKYLEAVDTGQIVCIFVYVRPRQDWRHHSA
jgi:hypothetical protein